MSSQVLTDKLLGRENVLIIIFAIGSSFGLNALLTISFHSFCLNQRHRLPKWIVDMNLPIKSLQRILGSISWIEIFLFPLALSVGIIWVIYHNLAEAQGWVWILQDLLGISLIISMFRSMRLPDMRIACFLIPALVAYDVFWVFFSNRFFGSSVMVKVAQGVRAHESLPFLIIVPHLASRDDDNLRNLQFRML